jgi:hypothetical protein
VCRWVKSLKTECGNKCLRYQKSKHHKRWWQPSSGRFFALSCSLISQSASVTWCTLAWVVALLALHFNTVFMVYVSRVAQSAQCLATGWPGGRSRFDPRQKQRIFPLASVSRPALRPTQPPVQWMPRVLSPVLKRGRGVTLSSANVENE